MIGTPRGGGPGGGATHRLVRSPLHREGGSRRAAAEGPRASLLRGGDDLFRSIYTRSGIAAHEVLAVTSAVEGEGKSTIALGLAVTIAQDFPDLRVILVETDVSRPVLASDFEAAPAAGLVNYLAGEVQLESTYRATFLASLRIVPAGTSSSNGARLLRSSRMAAAIDKLRDENDLVVLDLPAVLSNSDSLLLTDFADGVIFVTQAGETTTAVVNEALELLDPAKLRGVVLNRVASAVPRWFRTLVGI